MTYTPHVITKFDIDLNAANNKNRYIVEYGVQHVPWGITRQWNGDSSPYGSGGVSHDIGRFTVFSRTNESSTSAINYISYATVDKIDLSRYTKIKVMWYGEQTGTRSGDGNSYVRFGIGQEQWLSGYDPMSTVDRYVQATVSSSFAYTTSTLDISDYAHSSAYLRFDLRQHENNSGISNMNVHIVYLWLE